jgi:hypothetical protein
MCAEIDYSMANKIGFFNYYSFVKMVHDRIKQRNNFSTPLFPRPGGGLNFYGLMTALYAFINPK